MTTDARLAANVRAEMARRRVPQQTVAQRLGVSQSAVSRRVAGHTPFTVAELVQVADLLDLTLSDLIGVVTTDAA